MCNNEITCRLCAENKKDCITLKTVDIENIQLWDKLTFVAPEIVEENDDLPSNICTNCSVHLNEVYQYKRKFMHAYDKLKQPNIELENVKTEDKSPDEEDTSNDIAQFCEVNIKNEPSEIFETKNKYICQTCGKVFSVKSYLVHHIKRHNKQNFTHKCAKCPKKFLYNHYLVKHIAQAHSEQRKIANELDKSLNETCPICNKTFAIKSYLRDHLKRHNKNNLVHNCPVCSKKFLYNSYLIKHFAAVHQGVHLPNNSDDKTVKRRPNNHKTEQKRLVCEVCGKKFAGQNNLYAHKRIHTQNYLYQCEHCGKQFKFTGDFKMHLLIHSDQRPFACDLCESKFRQPGKLQQHKRVVHFGERPFKCPMCDKTYKQSAMLKIHQRLHSGEKPYQCTCCEKSFTCNSHLKRHLRIHTDERPYKCEVCDKGFTQRFNLKIHSRVHNK